MLHFRTHARLPSQHLISCAPQYTPTSTCSLHVEANSLNHISPCVHWQHLAFPSRVQINILLKRELFCWINWNNPALNLSVIHHIQRNHVKVKLTICPVYMCRNISLARKHLLGTFEKAYFSPRM
ncbi:hypothetical protein AMECASPLE_027489 [Ameca splendens]|uniref:Uncharacterized protein n=1 Tax=Ameca splendens TaxID=208324 RepID=A0ABV0Y5S0_9TELE